MTEVEAMGIIRSRLTQNGPSDDAELEEALSGLEKAVLLAEIQGHAAAGALKANEEDRIFLAACDAADSIRDEDVRDHVNAAGFAELAQNATDDEINSCAVSSIHGLLSPLTDKDSEGYHHFVEGAALEVIASAGLDGTKAR